MIDIKFSQFFDRPHVMAAVKRGGKTMLSKAGAFVRIHAQRLIRPRKRSSLPGEAPSGHVGLLRKLIFFGYDANADSVVIGPKLFGRGKSPTVPQLLEFGGKTKTPSGQPAVYHKFPYMAPALEAEAPKFPGLFSDVLSG